MNKISKTNEKYDLNKIDIENLRETVKNKLSEKRFKHVLGVEEMCVKLAEKYGADTRKARIAALLHDYMKETNVKILTEMCKDVPEVQGYENLFEILHGFAGAMVAEKEFGIEDEDILNAIKYHTIGREGISVLEKIVYIGDAIEMGRDYPNVQEIREKTFENLDKGIITEVERKIDYLSQKGGTIHIDTIKMRDDLLKNN